SAPLVRAILLRLGPEEHVLVLVLHHIVTDGWSMSILFRELALFYGHLALGHPSRLTPLPLQYVDFSHWQQERFAEQAWQTDIEYWKEKLRGCSPLLELPTDHPRPAVQSQRGSTVSFTVEETTASQLKRLCSQEGVTLYMGLLALFQVLLSRYTG